MNIVLGWWIAPALLTMAFLAGTGLLAPRMTAAGHGDVNGAMFQLLCHETALTLSLVAWLFWALL